MSKHMWGRVLFTLAVLLFMVIMGMSNRASVNFELMNKRIGTFPAAILYFIFFGVGLISGAVLAVGWWRAGK